MDKLYIYILSPELPLTDCTSMDTLSRSQLYHMYTLSKNKTAQELRIDTPRAAHVVLDEVPPVTLPWETCMKIQTKYAAPCTCPVEDIRS